MKKSGWEYEKKRRKIGSRRGNMSKSVVFKSRCKVRRDGLDGFTSIARYLGVDLHSKTENQCTPQQQPYSIHI